MATADHVPMINPLKIYVRMKRTINFGVANRNPLNIRYSVANRWLGQHPTSPQVKGFCRFLSFDHGYRAAIVLMKNYIELRGCNTPRSIVGRWAPPQENDTEIYLACVCGRSGLLPDELMRTDGMQIARLVAAMTRQETGLRVTPEYLQDLRERFGV